MPGVLQAALHRHGDVRRSRVGRGVASRWSGGGGRERGHGDARWKPAHCQGPLVLALPLTQLQTAEREREEELLGRTAEKLEFIMLPVRRLYSSPYATGQTELS